MKFSRTSKTLLIVLIVYLFAGAFIASLSQAGNSPDTQSVATFVFMMLIGPLLIVIAFLGIPGLGMLIGTILSLVLFIKRKNLLAATTFLTFLFLALGLLLPTKTITSSFSYQDVSWGFPIHFVRQDMSEISGAPIGMHIHFGLPLDNPTSFQWPQFALSFIIVFGAFYCVGYSLKTLNSRFRYLKGKGPHNGIKREARDK